MKQRKKRPVPPPPPVVVDEDAIEKIKKSEEDEEECMPPMMSPMIDLDDPVYLEQHSKTQALQMRTAQEGFVLLKNNGVLPLYGKKINVFGRHATSIFIEEVADLYGIEINKELLKYYASYKTKDAGYTGSGYDKESGKYIPQSRTSTGLFGNHGYFDPEPIIGYDVYNEDGSIRVKHIPEELLEGAKAFSDTAAIVIYREAGEGADHEKGDERLSEGEAAMLSYCSKNFAKVIVVLATNSVIDGDFLAVDTRYSYYVYTYGGRVYSNNIGNEVLADFDSRTVLKYLDADGNPAPHVYPIEAAKLGACIYTCNRPGDKGPDALMSLLTGEENPSGRLMDEIVFDYDDNPVSRCFGGLVFSRESTTDDRYIYGHNYVVYKEGVYLGYKYFETFCPEKVVYPFGFGLSYTSFAWTIGELTTELNEYDELKFSLPVTVTNTGNYAGKDVVELYVNAPYDSESNYHLEKPLVALASFEKTAEVQPGERDIVVLTWNARDIACYSDTEECYVLEAGSYHFLVSTNANTAHTAPEGDIIWENVEDILYREDEVTGTPYRNLFTGSEKDGWRYDARGTEKENIVYIHRIDVNGVPTVAPGTYPEDLHVDPVTMETAQILDLETRGLSSYYEMDATSVHFYAEDIPSPTTNAVYRTEDGTQKNFMLQDVYRFLKDIDSPCYHNADALYSTTGIEADAWTADTDELVWDHFLDQLSVNEMMCRFYHCGFDLPELKEYGIPVTYSADGPGQIGANNKMPLGRTTTYCDSILACTFNRQLLEEFGYALGREVAASGENGTSFFYAPGNNLHRSCLSGKNNNYYSEDAYLAGQACGYLLKGMEEGGVNGCMKHFACNDQEISREGLVVFGNEQSLRENNFAAFEHALKIGGGKGVMTSLGRVGTVNACGNQHLTVDLLRKEWGFDGMVITDGYGVTSYMYEINDMLGANSGLLCFGNSGNFGECRDFMELYRYYLQYPGRTTAALRKFMKGCMESVLRSHTFRDLYTDYDYYSSEDAPYTTDINWYEGQIGLGYEYKQAEALTYLGIKLMPGESNPPGMMPNTNCKDRGGTIRLDDYGIVPIDISGDNGEVVHIPVSMEKTLGMQKAVFSVMYDTDVFSFDAADLTGSVYQDYQITAEEKTYGVEITLETAGNVSSVPCGLLFTLELEIAREATPGEYPIRLLPALDEDGHPAMGPLDKQGHEMSFALTAREHTLGGGWSGVYQSVESSEWWAKNSVEMNKDDLADLTLLSGSVVVR